MTSYRKEKVLFGSCVVTLMDSAVELSEQRKDIDSLVCSFTDELSIASCKHIVLQGFPFNSNSLIQ